MGGGLSAPRWGRAPLFAYRGLRLPPLSWGRVTPGLAGVRRRGPCASGVWCASARAHARGVLPLLPWRCVSRGAWGAPARPAPPCAARAAAVSRPLLPFRARRWRVARGRGSGPPGFGRRFPGAWLRDGPNGWRLETGSRGGGPVGLDPRAVRCGAGPGSWGGSLRVLRPAGAAGVAGPPSCWWRWDPVHVYPVAWFASPLARPSPSPCPPPRARSLVLASCVCLLPAASGPPPVLCCFFFSPLRLGSDDRARVRPFSSPSPVTVSGPRPGLAACRVPAPPLGRHGSWGAGSRAECCRPRSRERRNGGKKRERGAGCARRGSGWGGARVVGRRACGRAFQGPVARLLRVAGPEGPLRGFAPGFAEGAGRVCVRGCHGTALVLEASGGGTPCAPRWRLGSAPSRRLVGNPWGSLAVGPRSCSPSLFAGASLPLPPGVRVVASSVRLPNPVARSGVWALPRPAAASSPCPPPPSGPAAVLCADGGDRPSPSSAVPPPTPRSGARAPGRGAGPGLSVVGCPATARPPPRWRGARVSARPPPRVSVCAGLLCQPRRDLSGAPSLARAPPPGCWGSARVGGGDVCVSSPASPRHRRCWPGPAGAGSVSPSRSLAAGWDGARLEWARRARLLLRLSLPAGSRAPGGRGAAAATAASPPPPPGRVAAPCSVRPVHRETCAAPRCALSLAHRAPTWLILPVATSDSCTRLTVREIKP